MSLRGFFNHLKPTHSGDSAQSESPDLGDTSFHSLESSNNNLSVKPQTVHLDAPQIRDIKYFMSQAGIEVNNDPTVLDGLTKAERTIRELPTVSTINLDSLAAIYQLIPRQGADVTANFKLIHEVIVDQLLPERLNETVTLILTYGQADDHVKLKLFLNIKSYQELHDLLMKENPANASDLFRALICHSMKPIHSLDAILRGLKSFYQHSKKKIQNVSDLSLIIEFIRQQNSHHPFAFNNNSALIVLYAYNMLTHDNLAHVARNQHFVNAVRVCAKYYNIKDYTFPPDVTLHIILTSLDLANYLVVIGQFLIKQMSHIENIDESKKSFVLQIQALLLSARACEPDKSRPNPHNVRCEEETPQRNHHVKNSLLLTFTDLLRFNNIDKFGNKLPKSTHYRGYYY